MILSRFFRGFAGVILRLKEVLTAKEILAAEQNQASFLTEYWDWAVAQAAEARPSDSVPLFQGLSVRDPVAYTPLTLPTKMVAHASPAAFPDKNLGQGGR